MSTTGINDLINAWTNYAVSLTSLGTRQMLNLLKSPNTNGIEKATHVLNSVAGIARNMSANSDQEHSGLAPPDMSNSAEINQFGDYQYASPHNEIQSDGFNHNVGHDQRRDPNRQNVDEVVGWGPVSPPSNLAMRSP